MNSPKKLSKSYAFSLKEGVYIACGCARIDEHGQGESIFHCYVPNVAERESFWMKIKEARADQRNCFIFKNKDEYIIFKSNIQEPKSKRKPPLKK
jgi:hypothetical protein